MDLPLSDKSVLPYVEIQHCMNQAIEQYKEELFTYSDQQGLYSLRVQLVRYLQNLQVAKFTGIHSTRKSGCCIWIAASIKFISFDAISKRKK